MKMTSLIILFLLLVFGVDICQSQQNALYIPPALTGTEFNLEVQSGTRNFYGNVATPTYGINGGWMAPTIIVNKGDSIQLNVTNNLPVRTTMHWHGMHVAAYNDGGPHQSISPSTSWNPAFKIRNNAATFWYHPHGEGQTEQQISKGLAGFFIVRDDAEAMLNLPRTYGIDDIPINVQSKAFDDLQQIAIVSHMDTAIFVNGTLQPFFNAPAQVIRLRLLNSSSLRSFNIGLSNNQSFYQIGTDGGLLNAPIELSRIALSTGERAEILVDFTGMTGQSVFLKSYSSELPHGIYGAPTIGNQTDSIHDYNMNYLNGTDFNLLEFTIEQQTTSPVNSIPTSLVPFVPFNQDSVTVYRRFEFGTLRVLDFDSPGLAEGPFGINDENFDMDVINEIIHINDTEQWTLINNTLIAHPFHIHDIQFNVVEKGGLPPSASETGWKDVVLVMPGDSVKFITRFETFVNDTVPYMYHCHLLHHEDDGMMGSFLVIDTTLSTGVSFPPEIAFHAYPNPVTSIFNIEFESELKFAEINVVNVLGHSVQRRKIANTKYLTVDAEAFSNGIYFLQVITQNATSTQTFIKQ